MYPKIYTRHEMSNAEYHAAAGISKSGLWTIYSRTPAHYKYGERKAEDGDALALGTAIHTAILEPEQFATTVARGPADRRGNKWAEACSLARLSGAEVILPEPKYEMALRIRDSADRCAILRGLRPGLIVESSAFAEGGAGLVTRCRPDGYHPRHKIMLDIKSTTDASPTGFAKACASHGYHVQDAFYSDTWQAAGGGEVAGFIFLAFEKEPPYLVAPYELSVPAQDEGRRIYRAALDTYRQCVEADKWHGYSAEIETLSLPRWAMPQE